MNYELRHFYRIVSEDGHSLDEPMVKLRAISYMIGRCHDYLAGCPRIVYDDADALRIITWTYYIDWVTAPMSLLEGIDMNCRIKIAIMDGKWKY